MLGKKDLREQIRGLVQREKYDQIVSLAFKDKNVVPELISLLGDSDYEVRGNAALALGDIGEKDPERVKGAVPALINLLGDSEEAAVQSNAAWSLGEIGGKDPEMVKEAVPPLIHLLGDLEEAEVQSNAAWSLGEIGMKDPEMVKEAVLPLIHLLGDSEVLVQYNAAWGLMIGISGKDPEVVKGAVPALITALGHSDAWARGYAAFVLGKIGHAAALPALRPLTWDTGKAEAFSQRQWVKTTVGEIAEEAIEKIEARIKASGLPVWLQKLSLTIPPPPEIRGEQQYSDRGG